MGLTEELLFRRKCEYKKRKSMKNGEGDDPFFMLLCRFNSVWLFRWVTFQLFPALRDSIWHL